MADNVAASYRALGLRIGATPEEVKQAYRDLIKIWHPDRFPDNAELRARAHARTAELNAAYECVEEHLRHKPPQPTRDHASPPPTPSVPPVIQDRTSPRSDQSHAPHVSSVRPDGSLRDYAHPQVICCRHCGHPNLFAHARKAFRCRQCGHDPLQQPSPTLTAPRRSAARPVRRMPLAPELAIRYRNMAFISRSVGVMGLVPGILLVGITAVHIAPEIEPRTSGQGMAIGLFLFVLVLALIAAAVILERENHPGQGTAIGLSVCSLLAGFVVTALSPITVHHPGRGTAIGLSVALLATGLTALAMATVAAAALSRAENDRTRKTALQGLLLGTVNAAVGIAILLASAR